MVIYVAEIAQFCISFVDTPLHADKHTNTPSDRLQTNIRSTYRGWIVPFRQCLQHSHFFSSVPRELFGRKHELLEKSCKALQKVTRVSNRLRWPATDHDASKKVRGVAEDGEMAQIRDYTHLIWCDI